MHRYILLLTLVCLRGQVRADEPWPMIERAVPPLGIVLDEKVAAELGARLEQFEQRAAGIQHPLLPDVLAFTKAVRYALELREFYNAKDVIKANELLDEAQRRLDAISEGTTPWTNERGTVVRGFRSAVDGSVQPYGMVIPADHDLRQAAPLYVWLHGRGDQTTDLHFVHQRLKQTGQIAPPGALVLHPFGRQCLGYKSAGQTDVFEAIAHVRQQYRVDPQRIVMIGFSMGGAGAWHLGAHYADQWVAVSPGAGFAETARYQRLTPDKYPPWYEQRLWGVYDVPDYVRNLFNVPVIAYSGENDKQIQAARVMEEAYASHGRQLVHLIGPGVEHKYEPATLKELLTRLESQVAQGRDAAPRRVFLQTRTLRYSRQHWVEALRLREHWQDSRVDANAREDGTLDVSTRNVQALALRPPFEARQLTIDGQSIVLTGEPASDRWVLMRDDGWHVVDPNALATQLAKKPGLQGPIDDAFLDPFLVVRPTGKSRHPAVDRWVAFELQHFIDRWRALFRGELRIQDDRDVTEDDMRKYHLVLWGDCESNLVLRRAMKSPNPAPAPPIQWEESQVRVGKAAFDAASHIPLFVFPNPLQPDKYLVVNSGPTFREAHDRTNSLQNPKLPDWAVLKITEAPTATEAGHVVAADFFDEAWRLKE